MPERPSLHALLEGWAGVARLKEVREYLLCKIHAAMHLPHSTVKRHHCGVWLKTKTP